VLVGKGGLASDDKRAMPLRKISCQIGRDGVGEIVLFRIVVEVREWQDNERQSRSEVGPVCCLSLRIRPALKNVGADRLSGIQITDKTTGNSSDGRN
jgi:hypothetical protein